MSSARASRQSRPQLRRARESRVWSRPDLVAELERQELVLEPGRLLRLDPKLVEKWERGDVCPRVFYRARLCLLFGVHADALGLPSGAKLESEIGRLARRLPLNDRAWVPRSPAPWVSQAGGGVLDEDDLEALDAATLGYGQARDISPPSVLHEAVEHHLEVLLDGLRRHPNAARRLRATAARTAIIAGWLAFNLGRNGRATAHWILARALAHETQDDDLEACALGCRSRLHSSVHSGPDVAAPSIALDLLDGAIELSSGSTDPALRSWLFANRAEQFAAAGRGLAADRDLELACRTISVVGRRDETLWARWSEARLRGYQGNCCRLLGRGTEAVAILERTALDADPAVIPARVFIKSDLAAACAQQAPGQDVDRACSLLGETLSAAHLLGFAEGIQRIDRVRAEQLVACRDARSVVHFDEFRRSLGSAGQILPIASAPRPRGTVA